MITELSFRNFKVWKQVEGMRFAPITGVFGSNSSGKTSIIQLLLLLKQTVESSDRLQVLNFGDERSAANLGSFQDVVHAHDAAAPLNWSVKWKTPSPLKIADPDSEDTALFSGSDFEFAAEVGENGGTRLAVRSTRYWFAGHVFSMTRKEGTKDAYALAVQPDAPFRFVRNPGRPWELPAPVKCYGFPNEVNAYYQNAGFLADLQLAFERLLSELKYLGPLREYPKRQYTWAGAEPVDMGQRGERVIDAILAARERGATISRGRGRRRQTLEQRVAEWLKELGLITSFSVEAVAPASNIYRVKVQRTASSAPVLITDVGFGVSQILPAIALCYYAPEGSTLIMEQPEIHLHPSVQSGLADVFIDAVKNRRIQIIFESHSEHLLRRLRLRIAEERLSPEKTALYFCEADAQGSRLTPLQIDLLGNISNWPKDFFGDEFGEMAAMSKAALQRRQSLSP